VSGQLVEIIRRVLRGVLGRFFVTQDGQPKRLHEYQVEAVQKITSGVLAQKPVTILLDFARQAGKTETIAFVITFLGILVVVLKSLFVSWRRRFPNGFVVVGFAPSDAKQAKEVLARTKQVYKRWVAFMRPFVSGLTVFADSAEQYHVGVRGEGDIEITWLKIDVRTAGDKSGGVEGSSPNLVFVEEVQDVSETTFYAKIYPSVSETGAPLLVAGTAGDHRDLLWRIRQSVKAYPERRVVAFYDRVKRRAAGAKNWLATFDELVRVLGIDSPVIRAKYFGEYADEEGNLVSEARWRKILIPEQHEGALAHLRRIQHPLELLELSIPEGWGVAVALDVARTTDRTVLKLGLVDYTDREARTAAMETLGSEYRPQVYEIYSHSWYGGVDYLDQVQGVDDPQLGHIDGVAELLPDEVRPLLNEFAVDATGDRGDMVAHLEREGFNVLPCQFSGSDTMGNDLDNTIRENRYGIVCAPWYTGRDVWATVASAGGGSLPVSATSKPPEKWDGYAHEEYSRNYHEFTNCARIYRSNQTIKLKHPDDGPDDYVDASILLVQSAKAGEPLPWDVLERSRGSQRIMSGASQRITAGGSPIAGGGRRGSRY